MCGETGIIREAVKQHVDAVRGNCPLVTVKCAFEYVGCHLQVGIFNHFTLYFSSGSSGGRGGHAPPPVL